MPVHEETRKGLSLNIFQLWNSGRKLGISVYSPTSDGGYSETWKSNSLGEDADAVKFLTGDANGDGKTEIIQLFDNRGKLGITVYSPANDGSYSQTWKSNNLGEGAGAIDFLAGDVNGDGKTDIIQLWDSFGRLGIIVYSPTDDGGYRQSWKSNKLGEGAAALTFMTADVNGDGKTDILQIWDSGGKLGLIVFEPTDDGGYRQSWKTNNLGESSAAITFLRGDVNGDGRTDILQLQDNNGKLGLTVYSSADDGSYSETWKNPSLGESSSAIAFLRGDVDGDGKIDIIQVRDNGEELGLTVYSSVSDGSYSETWKNPSLGETGTVGFLTGDPNSDGTTDIIHLQDIGGKLGLTVYSPTSDGGYIESGKSDKLGENSDTVKFLLGWGPASILANG